MEENELKNLLKFLKEETEKYVTKKPYNLVEEADLQAFLYGKLSEYFNKKNKEKYAYFTDEDGIRYGEGGRIKVYTIHCEYPRHIKIKENEKEELYCNKGRYDIAILKILNELNDEEKKFIDKTLIKYPVDVAFELKLEWHDNSKRRIGLNTIVNKIGEDLWVFGWDKKRKEKIEEGKFNPYPEGVKDKIVYPKTGVVFQVHLVREGMGVKEDLEDKLNEIIKKRNEYKGNDLPDIFIVYIEIDRYNKKVIKSFIIPKK